MKAPYLFCNNKITEGTETTGATDEKMRTETQWTGSGHSAFMPLPALLVGGGIAKTSPLPCLPVAHLTVYRAIHEPIWF